MRRTELRYAALRAGFEILAATHVTAIVRRLSTARGVVLTMHRVLPDPPAEFAPNAILQITPSYLDQVIRRLRALGIELVDLDEALRRVAVRTRTRPFATLTFDDAYRDNLEHALPVLRRHDCPFTLFVPTAFPAGCGEVWWQALEDGIAARDDWDLGTKQARFRDLYRALREAPERERRILVGAFAADLGLDLAAHCRDVIMDWDEVAVFATEPLCTIGAHTVHHYPLARLDEGEVARELAESARELTQRFGTPPAHLAYPFGDRASAGEREFRIAGEVGFRSAVTTIPGGLYHRHAERLTALPRVSLNGRYQRQRFVDVFATPAVFTAARRV